MALFISSSCSFVRLAFQLAGAASEGAGLLPLAVDLHLRGALREVAMVTGGVGGEDVMGLELENLTAPYGGLR